MNKHNNKENFNIGYMILDILLIILSYFLSQNLYYKIRNVYLGDDHLWMCIVFSFIYVLVMGLTKMYDVTTRQDIISGIMVRGFSSLISAACLCIVIFLSKNILASRLFFLFFVLLSTVSIITLFVINRLIYEKIDVFDNTEVLFIGSKKSFKKYSQFMNKTLVKVNISKYINLNNPILKSTKDFEEYLKSNVVNEVVIVQNILFKNKTDIRPVLKICEDMGVTTRILFEEYEMNGFKSFVGHIGPFPMLTYHGASLDSVQIFFKSVMDIVGAIFGIIVASPIFIGTAIAIKLESPDGPVLFKQVRVGRNGKRFEIYKFRSMYPDAEERKKELMAQNKVQSGLIFKIDDDPRITKVGKFIRKTSIDELPQLINVLKREMSLVGTRPPTIDEVEKYERCHHRRISITPGITGMWQANGRSDITDFEKIVDLDNQYIDEWSLALDIKLIFKTVTSVLTRKGAS